MNTFGISFCFTSFGESHGPAVGGVIDGCPAGLRIDNEFVAAELLRRRLGDNPSPATTSRHEPDEVEWLSGIYEGKTLGTPIAFMIRNVECRSEDYESLRNCFRPGHADYVYQQKYGCRDYRGGGRASGRETASRVVAGAVAKQFLSTKAIRIEAFADNRLVSCSVYGLPAGVGEPIFDRLNARLAYAMFSIPSAMSFAMGDVPEAWQLPQDQFPDQWIPSSQHPRTETNHCGGVQGGISNGMPIQFHVGFHAPVTQPVMSCLTSSGDIIQVQHHGRHDTDHTTRLPVIVEAMAALVLADLIIINK